MTYRHRRHHDVFFAAHVPGDPYICFWCDEPVDPWNETLDVRDRLAFCVHHLDHDHDNNVPENLVAAHYGCHIAYHRVVRPLVQKGQKLPDEWARKITEHLYGWHETLSEAGEAAWLASVREGIANIDRTPTMCPDCGDGPFQGIHGVSMHKNKGVCDNTEVKLGRAAIRRRKLQAAGEAALTCECGKGPFPDLRAYRTHLAWHTRKAADYRRLPEKTVYCTCGAGPYKSEQGVRVHKGIKGCNSSLATD